MIVTIIGPELDTEKGSFAQALAEKLGFEAVQLDFGEAAKAVTEKKGFHPEKDWLKMQQAAEQSYERKLKELKANNRNAVCNFLPIEPPVLSLILGFGKIANATRQLQWTEIENIQKCLSRLLRQSIATNRSVDFTVCVFPKEDTGHFMNGYLELVSLAAEGLLSRYRCASISLPRQRTADATAYVNEVAEVIRKRMSDTPQPSDPQANPQSKTEEDFSIPLLTGNRRSIEFVRKVRDVRATCVRRACDVRATCVRRACDVRATCVRRASDVRATCVRSTCEVRCDATGKVS